MDSQWPRRSVANSGIEHRIWRFGWRAAYDRSPLPRRDLVQQEWDRFVEQDAIPVFDQHMDEIVAAVQQTIAEIAANQAVTEELAAVINRTGER